MSERVLLVDDEDFVLRALRGHLAPRIEAGEFAVATAVDGPDALEKAKAAVKSGNPFDLAVIDFQMTDEMNGLQTLQELRKLLPDLTAIMLTGQAQQSTPMEALNLGFRHYLVKPATREAFLQAVDGQIRQIRLAKRNRQMQAALIKFHATIRQLLSMVQSVAEMAQPVDLAVAVPAVIEAALSVADAKDGFLLLLPQQGDVFLVHDRAGKPVEGVTAPVGQGAAGMCLTSGAPVIVSAEAGKLAGADVGPLERGKAAVIAVPLPSSTGRIGAVLITDPARPDEYSDRYERSLALLGRLGGLVLESVLAQGQSRRMLLGALKAGMSAGGEGGGDEHLLEQLQATVRALDQGLAGGLPSPPGQSESSAGDHAREDARIALEMAACIHDISRYGPEGLEFCRSMLNQFRSVLKVYCE